MASNRLYIGNKETLEKFCLTKPDGDFWCELSNEGVDGFNRILKTDLIWNTRTNLVLFSESDTAWFDYFFNGGVLPCFRDAAPKSIQLCPKCLGEAIIPNTPLGMHTSLNRQCPVCNGSRVFIL